MFSLRHVSAQVPHTMISGVWGFFFTARDTVCMLKQWRHGAMVGWGNGWLNCIVIYMQKWTLSVCITAQNPLMMACIYTNTQTCTYAVHTEDLFTCTYTHICISLDKIWVRPIHCDQPVGFGGQVSIGWPKKKSMIHHQLGTLIKLVGLWKRSALSFLFYLSQYDLFFFFASLWYCCLQCDKHLLCISRFFELHTTPQSSLCFFSLFSVKWCLLSKQ